MGNIFPGEKHRGIIMKTADRIKELQPLNMDLYDGSFVSGKQQNYIKLQYYFDKITSKLTALLYLGNNKII